MKVEAEDRGAHSVVRLKGTIAVGETTHLLSQTLDRLEKEKLGSVIVDLSGLKSLDSTALGQLVGSLRRLRAAGREMVLVGPNEGVSKLLAMTQLDTIFPIHATLDGAFDAFERMTGGVTDRDDRRGNKL